MWKCKTRMGLTKDIGEVVATVLREGPDKHWGKDYYLSIDFLKMSEVAGKKLKLMILIKNNKKKCLIWYHHLEEEIIWKVLKL